MRNWKNWMLAAVIACLMLALGACDSQTPPEATQPATTEALANPVYTVKVVDTAGNPYTSDVIVRFMKGEEQIAMQPVNENGEASKELEAGEYTFQLVFTGDENAYHYDESDLTLTAANAKKTVTLNRRMTENTVALFAPEGETVAHPVEACGTYVELTPGKRNYFLFAPSVAGTYEVSSSGQTLLGYYGAPHFVQAQSLTDVVDNTLTVSVSAGMIGATYVFGIDTGTAETCVLTINRIGDAKKTLADEPWTVYEPTAELTPFTLEKGTALIDFDLTANYTLVLNEKDGYYHLDTEDGPLVLMRLGVDNSYLASFKTILEYTGVNRYFFDETGAFVKKESYSECLMEYLSVMDPEAGVYPLTEDLKYIIIQEGEDSGWWDTENSLYLFVDNAGIPIKGINRDIAWLFMCCYAAQ